MDTKDTKEFRDFTDLDACDERNVVSDAEAAFADHAINEASRTTLDQLTTTYRGVIRGEYDKTDLVDALNEYAASNNVSFDVAYERLERKLIALGDIDEAA